mmetsp:Transcript_5448/g.18230  ORF Transcript_5448/g.18230 Transcript_5448/m.18230 type:complete len:211 (-) Transcript_5448:521-1153(-)
MASTLHTLPAFHTTPLASPAGPHTFTCGGGHPRPSAATHTAATTGAARREPRPKLGRSTRPWWSAVAYVAGTRMLPPMSPTMAAQKAPAAAAAGALSSAGARCRDAGGTGGWPTSASTALLMLRSPGRAPLPPLISVRGTRSSALRPWPVARRPSASQCAMQPPPASSRSSAAEASPQDVTRLPKASTPQAKLVRMATAPQMPCASATPM